MIIVTAFVDFIVNDVKLYRISYTYYAYDFTYLPAIIIYIVNMISILLQPIYDDI